VVARQQDCLGDPGGSPIVRSRLQLNHAQRELTVKVVYYGPGLSGKTTNLQMIHARTHPDVRGRLLTVETHDDRTLFFDLLPVFFQSSSGFRVKVKLFTVPGQVLHNTTRRIVLQGADGVAFIADGRRAANDDNNAYWQNMLQNMADNDLDPEVVPVVIQFNKRDLPGTLDDNELEEARQKGREAVFGAVAIRGEGVLETLAGVLERAYQSLDARSNLERTTGLAKEEFLRAVFARMDLAGTSLQERFGPRAAGDRPA
jgi:mutual gliding-motility protein MglA